MTVTESEPRATADRLGPLFERPDGVDFPFYDGRPEDLGVWRWGLLVVASAAGFVVLSLTPGDNQILLLVGRILFVAIPLVTFIVLAGPSWKSIFRPLRRVDALTMIIFWSVYMVVSILLSQLITAADPGHVTANRAADQLSSASEIGFFYVGTFIQLFGEELFSLIPFLAVLYVCFTRLHLSRTLSIVIAWGSPRSGSPPHTCRPTTGTCSSASSSSDWPASCSPWSTSAPRTSWSASARTFSSTGSSSPPASSTPEARGRAWHRDSTPGSGVAAAKSGAVHQDWSSTATIP